MGAVEVVPVRDRADQKAFLGLPYRLYAGHPVWVPPLRMAEADLMNQAKNPFFEHGEVQHFLARRGGRVVGRVAAIENRLHIETHKERVGFFGFFDVEPDPEAATALIAAAGAWCDARDLAPMRGPVCYSTNDVCGVLVEGFDDRPMIMMPYNRPDYAELLEAAGLVAVKDLLAFWIPIDARVPERFRRVVERRLSRTKTTVRELDLENFEREVDVLRDLYNRCWEKNWSFVPATDAEFQHAAADLKRIVDPKMSGVVLRDGEPIAFSVFVKDVNEALVGLDGRLLPFGWLKLLLRMRTLRRRRCVLLGIVPEARGGGVNEALFIHAERGATAQAADIDGAEAGWVLEDNAAMRAPIEAMGGTASKRYRLYETSP